jgi:putative transposase
MPRQQRYRLPGVPQHVIQRGNNRQVTFFDNSDYRKYLDCLQAAGDKHGCAIHAYVLMTNHVHLLLTPETPDGIGKLMQSVGRRYVQYVNTVYQRTGTLWEGRYKASPVESERYLLTCYRYIELNPVRAGMVEGPADYAWSSYRHNAFGEANAVITRHERYRALGGTDTARQRRYRELFRHHMDNTLLHEIRETTNQCRVLGNDRFREQIEAALQIKATPRRRGRPKKEKKDDAQAENRV